MIFQIAGVLAFPLDQTTKPLSESTVTRVLSRLIVALFASAGAANAALEATRVKTGS